MLGDFEGYTTEDINSWITIMGRLSVAWNSEPLTFLFVRARRVFELSYRFNCTILCGLVPNLMDFHINAMHKAILHHPIHDMFQDADHTTEKLDTFSYEKWTNWKGSTVTVLKTQKV